MAETLGNNKFLVWSEWTSKSDQKIPSLSHTVLWLDLSLFAFQYVIRALEAIPFKSYSIFKISSGKWSFILFQYHLTSFFSQMEKTQT